ncbi:hypothetical protein OSTOST_24235 [Ostertagia ostertagi]
MEMCPREPLSQNAMLFWATTNHYSVMRNESGATAWIQRLVKKFQKHVRRRKGPTRSSVEKLTTKRFPRVLSTTLSLARSLIQFRKRHVRWTEAKVWPAKKKSPQSDTISTTAHLLVWHSNILAVVETETTTTTLLHAFMIVFSGFLAQLLLHTSVLSSLTDVR